MKVEAVLTRAKGKAGERLGWIDAAKGIGIVLVALGHAIRGVLEDVSPVLRPALCCLDYLIYSFHMPLFFLLAGYVAATFGSRPETFSRFFSSRFWTIVYPYLLWSLIIASLQAVVSSAVNWNRIQAHPWTLALFPVGIMWFLHATFFCQLVYFLCGNISAKEDARFWAGLSLIAVTIYCAVDFPLYWSVLSQDLYGLTFFALGVALKKADRGFAQGRSAMILWTLLCVAGLVAVWVQHDVGIGVRHPLRLLSGGIIALSVMALCASGPSPAGLRLLGQRSLVIYLVHTLIAAAVLKLGVKLGWTLESELSVGAMLLVMTAVSTLGSLLFHFLAARLGFLPWLGLTVPRRFRRS